MNILNLYLGFSLFYCSAAYSQVCNNNLIKSASNDRYQLNFNNGLYEVVDKRTNLIWLRCSIGQAWNGETCTGTAKSYDWKAALIAVKAIGKGYRIPNIKELQSLVEDSCYASSINEVFFPATSPVYYWSSSAVTNSPDWIWTVNFNRGNLAMVLKFNTINIRAVRTGD